MKYSIKKYAYVTALAITVSRINLIKFCLINNIFLKVLCLQLSVVYDNKWISYYWPAETILWGTIMFIIFLTYLATFCFTFSARDDGNIRVLSTLTVYEMLVSKVSTMRHSFNCEAMAGGLKEFVNCFWYQKLALILINRLWILPVLVYPKANFLLTTCLIWLDIFHWHDSWIWEAVMRFKSWVYHVFKCCNLSLLYYFSLTLIVRTIKVNI